MMKKRMIAMATAALMLVVAFGAHAADGDTLWATKMGGTSWAVAADAEGNIYTAGWFNGITTFGSFELVAAYNPDLFITMTDRSGDVLWWATQIGGKTSSSENDRCEIAADPAGNVYIVGKVTGPADFGGLDPPEVDGNVFVAKLDGLGNFVWAKRMGAKSGLAIALDGEGNVYATGGFENTAAFGTIELVARGPANRTDIFVVKLDNDGNFVWAKRMGTDNGNEQGEAITVDAAGSVYITGDVNTGTADFGTIEHTLTSSSVFVTKMGSDQDDFVWVDSQPFSIDNRGIVVDDAGSVFTAGEAFRLGLVWAHDSDGVQTWLFQIAGGIDPIGIDDVEAWAMVLDAAGNLCLTGWFDGPTDFDPNPTPSGVYILTPTGGWDIFVLTLDTDGDFVSARAIGGPDKDRPYDIAVDGEGNLGVTGTFQGTVDFGPDPDGSPVELVGGGSFVLKLSGPAPEPEAPQMPLAAWPMGLAVLAAGAVAIRRRKNRMSKIAKIAMTMAVMTLLVAGAAHAQPLAFTLQPVDQLAYQNDHTQSWTVAVTGGSGSYTYAWELRAPHLGVPNWTPAGALGWPFPANLPALTCFGSTTYNGVEARCVVSDGVNPNITSNGAFQRVYLPMRITDHPDSGVYYTGTTVTLTVAADRGSTLGYLFEWRLGGVPVIEDGNHVGVATAQLTIPSAALADGGTYTCWVKDDVSSLGLDGMELTSNGAVVNVYDHLSITTHPVGGSFNAQNSESHQMTVGTSGGRPSLSYEWRIGGAALVEEAGHIEGVDTDTLDLIDIVYTDDGTYTCNVTDAATDDETSNGAVVDVADAVAPNATAITPSTLGPTSVSVDFEVVFDEAVQNVNDAADVIVTPTGSVSSTGVDIVVIDAATYTVTVTGITGEGTITLAVDTGSDVQDLAGNPLASSVTSAAVLISTPPIATAITPSTTGPTNADDVDFEVVFDMDVVNFNDAADVIVTHTGTANTGVSIAVIDAATYTVTVTGISGDGSFTLEADTTSDVESLLEGIALFSSVTSDPVLIDNTPDATAITPATLFTNQTSVDFEVVFDMGVVNFDDAADVIVTHTDTTSTGVSIAVIDAATYTVTVTGISGPGSFTLAVDATSDVQSLDDGTPLDTSVTSDPVVIEYTPPNATAITPSTTGPTNVDNLNFTVVFDEGVQYFNDADDVVVTHTGTASTAVSMAGGPVSWTVTVEGITGDGSFTLAVDTTSDVEDLAGNGPPATSVTSVPVLIDNTPPQATDITTTIPSPTNLNTVAFTVVFDVPVWGFNSASDVIVTHTGTASTGVSLAGAQGSDTYTVTVNGITGNGSFTLEVNVGPYTARDLAGNLLVESVTSDPLVIDNIPPIVVIGAPSVPVTANGPVDYTVSYALEDEVTLGVEDIRLNVTPEDAVTATVGLSGTKDSDYTVTLSDIAGEGELGFTILAGTATDEAGNSAGPAKSPEVTVTTGLPVAAVGGLALAAMACVAAGAMAIRRRK